MVTKPWFERPEWKDKPGLHALIVGISAYSHLPLRKEDLQEKHFGMVQLSSAALTAFRLAKVVAERADDFDPPLATCRLLLAPSHAEIKSENELAGFSDAPNYSNFSKVAKAWRTDACAHPDGTTFFYLAGHGIQRVSQDHVLLLDNFADGEGAAFSNKGININRLVNGMAASEGQETIARKQLYFFDACRVEPAALRNYGETDAGTFWDYKERPGDDDRAKPLFFAAKPGGLSYAAEGGETLCGGALMRSLRGGAGVPLDKSDPGDSDYVVSATSLTVSLSSHVDAINREREGAARAPGLADVGDEFILLRLPRPPDVRVLLTVTPETAAAFAKVHVFDGNGKRLETIYPFDPNPREFVARAGPLQVRARLNPAGPELRATVRKTYNVSPPEPCSLPALTFK